MRSDKPSIDAMAWEQREGQRERADVMAKWTTPLIGAWLTYHVDRSAALGRSVLGSLTCPDKLGSLRLSTTDGRASRSILASSATKKVV